MLKVIQIITGGILVIWMIITTMFYLSAGAYEGESRPRLGIDLYEKYTPLYWKKVTRWVVLPSFFIYVLTLFFHVQPSQ